MFIPHELALLPSRIYRALMLLTHGLALAGIGLSHIPYWVKALFAMAVMTSLIVLWRQRWVRVEGLRITQSGQVELRQNGWHSASIIGHPVVLPWLVSLTVSIEGGRRQRIILLPDSAGIDSFRKLKAWLRWGYQASK